MSTNLDKSLDDIIKSKPRTKKPVKKASGVKKATKGTKAKIPTGPAAGTGKKSQSKKVNRDQAILAAAQATFGDAVKLANRIVISNLPSDVTERAVREYMGHEVGPVSRSVATYNQKGVFTGQVSVTFKRPGDASKAVSRFNGTAIDGGAKIMKVELVMDPSKKPLAARLAVPRTNVAAPVSKPVKVKPTKKGPAPTASSKKGTSKKVRKPKKTLEELDAEMADYFGGNEAKP